MPGNFLFVNLINEKLEVWILSEIFRHRHVLPGKFWGIILLKRKAGIAGEVS